MIRHFAAARDLPPMSPSCCAAGKAEHAVAWPDGNVTIAPRRPTELISLTARQLPGRVWPGQVPRWPLCCSLGRRASEAGVSVQMVHTVVIADCYLIAAPDPH